MRSESWQHFGRGWLWIGVLLALMTSCLPITPTLQCRPCPCSEAHGYTCVGGLCVRLDQKQQATKDLTSVCSQIVAQEPGQELDQEPSTEPTVERSDEKLIEPMSREEPPTEPRTEPLPEGEPHPDRDAAGPEERPFEPPSEPKAEPLADREPAPEPLEPTEPLEPMQEPSSIDADAGEPTPERPPESSCPGPPRCPKQAGVCRGAAPQTPVCQGGQWVCTDADYLAHSKLYSRTDKTCDGVDNDCSGLTDQDAINCAITVMGPPRLRDGPGAQAVFQGPWDLARDTAGNLFITDTSNSAIRKLDSQGQVTTFFDFRTITRCPSRPILLSPAMPAALAIDAKDVLYVTDIANHMIWKITPSGVASCLAGTQQGYKTGKVDQVQFSTPQGIAVNKAGTAIYVADTNNHVIRKIDNTGDVSLVAGIPRQPGNKNGAYLQAEFRYPKGLHLLANGELYVADSENHVIRKLTNNTVSTFAGLGPTSPATQGTTDGDVTKATFRYPLAITSDGGGTFYVSDTLQGSIRRIANGLVTTITGGPNTGQSCAPGPSLAAYRYNLIRGLLFQGSKILFVSAFCNKIFQFDPNASQQLTVQAGDGPPAYREGNTPQISMERVRGLALFNSGKGMYIADRGNTRIRKAILGPDQTWTTSLLAGSDIRGDNDGKATVATFFDPISLALDETGQKLYVGEARCIRRIDLSTTALEVLTLSGDCKRGGFLESTTNRAALYNDIQAIALGPQKQYLYIADSKNHMVRRLHLTSLIVERIVGGLQNGTPQSGHSPNNTSGKLALLDTPAGLTFYAPDKLLISDANNNRVKVYDLMTQQVSTSFGPTVPLAPPQPSPTWTLSIPGEIAVQPQTGVIYFVNEGTRQLAKYDPQTKQAVILTSPGGLVFNGPLSDAQFDASLSFIFSPTGDFIYTSSSRSHRIRRIKVK